MAMILEVKDICKKFPGVNALDCVSMDVMEGEVHALVGENGAGKSTLIKIIAGIIKQDSGNVIFEDKQVNFKTPLQAIEAGISTIHQELNLCENISVAENIFIGRLPKNKYGYLDRSLLRKSTISILSDLGMSIYPEALVQSLSTAQKQLVEIGKALSYNAKVIIMDEPTSALGKNEIENFFRIIKMLQKKGVSIIYVSHKLEEIFALADRITVLRDGELIATTAISQMDTSKLISMMVGRKLQAVYDKQTSYAKDEKLLIVNDLNTNKLNHISFDLKKGEILGFSGLMGAGRTELARAIFGVDKYSSGEIILEGEKLKKSSASYSKRFGMGFIPEERKLDGIIPNLTTKENITIASLNTLSKISFIQKKKEVGAALALVNQLNIKTPSLNQNILNLSGGNQQKTIISKWLLDNNIKILIIDEPTRGIDVVAKTEIYILLDNLAKSGLSIIIMSSEMQELICICDRIYVLCKGSITGELTKGEVTQEKLLEYAVRF